MDPARFIFAEVVPEDDLRNFSKCGEEFGKILYDEYGNVEKWLGSILKAIIKTAHRIDVTPSHRAAATNAICSILEIQSNSHLRDVFQDEDLLLQAFNVVLDRSEVAKGKSMRQLLVALINVARYQEPVLKQRLVKTLLLRTLRVICHQSDQVKGKTALQVISTFLSQGLIGLEKLAGEFSNFQAKGLPSEANSARFAEQVQELLHDLFSWVGNRDTAHVASRTVLICVREWNVLQVTDDKGQVPKGLPIWVRPLVRSILEHPEALQEFKNQVFPELFTIDATDYLSFLEHLGLQEVLQQDHGSILNLKAEKKDLVAIILYASLQVGKETGLVVETEAFKCGKKIELDKQTIRIQDVILTKLLSHSSQTVRLAGLSLIVSSASVTRALTPNGLDSIKRNLYHLFAESDSSVRGETLSIMQRLIDRIRAAMAYLHKTITRSSKAGISTLSSSTDSLDTLLRAHWAFMQWLLRFLSAGLRPGAPYQRHMCSLKALLTVAKSGIDPSISTQYLAKQGLVQIKWPYQLTIFTPWIERSLLDLTMDAFDDVRSLAVTLLDMNQHLDVLSMGATDKRVIRPSTTIPRASKNVRIGLVHLVARAEEIMLSSSRPDHADGFSRTYAVLFQRTKDQKNAVEGSVENGIAWSMTKLGIFQRLLNLLEHAIKIAEKDLYDAIHRFPIHGTLASIRYIIDSRNFYSAVNSDTLEHRRTWQHFHTYLVNAIHRVWHCVHAVLCNDAPEGYVPEDMETEPDIDTKDILSFSWRALKEASSLLRIIVLKSPLVDEPDSESPVAGLKVEDLKRLVTLTFTQLTELRHRGAFSAVAHAYTACCLRSRQIGRIDILEDLYNDTLACIRLQGSKITRRSAGIPSIIVGILSADPEGSLFHRTMADLKAEAEAPPAQKVLFGDPLPQVHALNCLRAIFLNTALGTSSERHITTCLHLAAKCLTSHIWAIRNCGLMLFKSLIDRLLGSTDSQNWSGESVNRSSRFTYRDAPGLLDIVIKLLRRSTGQLLLESTAVESAFPALQLLQRVPPPAGSKAEIRDLVLELCSSPHWHVREMAARTHLALMEQGNSVDIITSLLPSLDLRQNQIHGRLLCIRYAVSAICQNQDRQEVALTARYTELFENNPCPITRTAYVDILNILGMSLFRDRPRCETSYLPPILTSQLNNEHPLLEKAVAVHVLLQVLLGTMPIPTASQQKSYLQTLAIEKPNIFTWVLSNLDHIMDHLPQEIPSGALRDLLLEIATTTEVHELAAIACRTFMRTVDWESIAVMPLPDLSQLPVNRVFQMKCAPSPAVIAAAIQISGNLLDLMCVAERWHPSVRETLTRLLSKLRQMLQPNEPFDLRHAAVSCLGGFDAFWSLPLTLDGYAPLYLQATLLVHDSLNDDSSEIRELAACTARRILETQSNQTVQPMVPLVASRKLSQHLTSKFPTSTALAGEGLWRLTGSRLRHGNLTPSAIQQFSEARQESTVLFAIEKQNLFVDEVREAVIWTRALKRLSNPALTVEQATALSKWVTEGLRKLIDVAEAEFDGPLGWSSKSDMFILGMRIILATDVLLHWRKMTQKVSIPGSSLRLLLGQLVAAAERGHLHDMWLESAKEVLVNSILGRIGTIHGILHGVENSINVDKEQRQENSYD